MDTRIRVSTFIIGVLIVSCLQPAMARSQYSSARVKQIAAGPIYGGDVVIRVEGPQSGTIPSCVTDGTWTHRFDGTTPEGKQAYTLALTAWATGHSVAVWGEGTCELNGQTEDLRWIRGQ